MSAVEPRQAPCLCSYPGEPRDSCLLVSLLHFIGEQVWPAEICGFTETESKRGRQLRLLQPPCFHAQGGILESSVTCPVVQCSVTQAIPSTRVGKIALIPVHNALNLRSHSTLYKTIATFQKKLLGSRHPLLRTPELEDSD